MCDETLLNSILLDWASKSPNGLIEESLSEDDLQALYESLVSNGISESNSINLVNDVGIISEKGKHPERQAYNKNGILVTFPTPEYKARAMANGTHFEKDPKVGQSNLFGGGNQAPQAGGQPTPSAPGMDAKQTTLPPSDSSNVQTPPAQKEIPEPGTSGTPASPAPAPSSALAPSTEPPAQGQLASEPIPQNNPPNVATQPAATQPTIVQKTPSQLAADKNVIKQILNTDDTMPTVGGTGGISGLPGIGMVGTSGIGNKLSEQLQKLAKVAIEMNLNEAVKFLSNHL